MLCWYPPPHKGYIQLEWGGIEKALRKGNTCIFLCGWNFEKFPTWATNLTIPARKATGRAFQETDCKIKKLPFRVLFREQNTSIRRSYHFWGGSWCRRPLKRKSSKFCLHSYSRRTFGWKDQERGQLWFWASSALPWDCPECLARLKEWERRSIKPRGRVGEFHQRLPCCAKCPVWDGIWLGCWLISGLCQPSKKSPACPLFNSPAQFL